jgi:hypothetical protein
LQHEKLGRLLFFDPTDNYTALGYLPDEEQGSLSLIVSPDSEGLLPLPFPLPENNILKREVKAMLSAEGALKASVREECTGNSAGENRSYHRRLTPEEYRKMIERWISQGAPGSLVTDIKAGDQSSGGFFVDVDFSSPSYARLMGGELMIFKPSLVNRRSGTLFTEDNRKYPIVLAPDAFVESAEILLPPGFVIDEIPKSFSLGNDFGKYDIEWRSEAGKIYFNRSMQIMNTIVAPKDYALVKQFFNRIASAEQAPVVLSRR